MIAIEKTDVVGLEHAIRGMRNPMNSWDKSDSYPAVDCGKCGKIEREGICRKEDRDCTGFYCYDIGFNDMALMQKLAQAGTDHRKFMRMIVVYCDITAPLYWWKEFDTYKVGTVANSCSTMHKIHSKLLTLDDFSCERLSDDGKRCLEFMIGMINCKIMRFVDTDNKEYFDEIIQLLPSSYNQKRTVMMNYEVLARIYNARKNHKLQEWRVLCSWIETLPYSFLMTGKEGEPDG